MGIFRPTLVILVIIAGVAEGQTPFTKYYQIQWGGNHATILNNETRVELLLDKYSGAGFDSKENYLSGIFHIRMKVPENKSPGVITTFFLSGNRSRGTHNELDFEFIGTNDQPILNTNIFANDSGHREQSIHLWFDPTTDFHTCTILWNEHHIVFYVDDTPIRIFKNHSQEGVNFPSGPMRIESSIWNGTWAGAVDWAKGPFKAQYEDFSMTACPESNGPVQCASPSYFWNRNIDLSPQEQEDYENVQKKYLFYDYCVSRPQKECQLPYY